MENLHRGCATCDNNMGIECIEYKLPIEKIPKNVRLECGLYKPRISCDTCFHKVICGITDRTKALTCREFIDENLVHVFKCRVGDILYKPEFTDVTHECEDGQFTREVKVTEIKIPNAVFIYHHMHNICSEPVDSPNKYYTSRDAAWETAEMLSKHKWRSCI